MTEEELLKEAEVYADWFWGASPSVMRALAKAYVKGAEPREKRIKELEAQIVSLEKENAELKSIADFQTSRSMNRYFQLTKAKDLIRNLLRVTYGKGWNYNLDWKVKAEEFLKEME